VAQTASTELTGKQKAAVLLISLGPEVSSRVFKHLREDEIESVSLEIAGQRSISAEIKEKVLYEFYQIYQA
jgi:flagellar motor switch protein FliG